FFYWADKLGLLVWGEMPSAYRFTHLSVERITAEWTEAIDRDMNHPSLVVWVPFNESWGVPDLAEKVAHQSAVQALYHLTKTLDATRPVIGNDGWESTATDILGIHDYEHLPERLLEKYASSKNIGDVLSSRWPGGRMLTVEGYPHTGQPVMLTEFGGIACIDPADSRDRKNWGYTVCESPDELRGRYEALLKAVHRIELFDGFCYTQFTDTFQEANGLFTMDRQPKFPLEAMAWATRGAGYTRGELSSVPQAPILNGPPGNASPLTLDHLVMESEKSHAP
ncbi:MAG: glycoside hydrolase family 2, partial [Proteobacteria bacterium]